MKKLEVICRFIILDNEIFEWPCRESVKKCVPDSIEVHVEATEVKLRAIVNIYIVNSEATRLVSKIVYTVII